jgi:hypothetical protein
MRSPLRALGVLALSCVSMHAFAQDSGAGLNTALPEYGSEVESREGVAVPGGFDFHGYLRVPARIGIGPHHDGSAGKELHVPPRAPDMSFTSWEYTHNHVGPWVDLVLSYGNDRVTATTSIASRNPTIASYRNLQAQLGINTAFVTLRFPEAFGTHGGLSWDVGALSNRYGTAGKHNAGMYQTYLFGRTRVAGETLTADVGIGPHLVLVLEHGLGAKIDVIPFAQGNGADEAYPGPVPQGSTYLHHAHAELTLLKTWQLGLHHLTVWSSDDRKTAGIDGVIPPSEPGRLMVYGGELRFMGGVYGDGYVGFSRVEARDILSIADGLELLHSQNGWQFRNNFFGAFDARDGSTAGDPNGRVDTLLFQYELSLGKILRHPERFWGNGPDLTAVVYGMFNAVDHAQNPHKKLKYGAEVIYKMLAFLSAGARYDLVRPDLDNARRSFSSVTGELVFRTNFTGHERIVLKYSRYFYGGQVYPAFPYADITQLDRDVLSITANMWW